MRLIRFKADGVHGYLRFDIKFNQDLTFLTGINGSGKTSAINAIVSLITPDLYMLAELVYRHVEVQVENENNPLTIFADADDNFIYLRCSTTDQALQFPRYSPDPDAPQYKQTEHTSEFYRELMASQANHPVLRAIAALPTPMFLGIDRRATLDEDIIRRQKYNPIRPARVGRNVFSRSLANSLAAASFLAQDSYRDALIQSGRIAERLQREMLLSLLSAPGEATDYSRLTLPTDSDLKEIDTVKRDLDSISAIMRLPSAEVKRRIIPLLDTLKETADKIPNGINVEEILRSPSDRSSTISAIFRWSSSQIHLKTISVISDTVSKYNSFRAKTLEPSQKYQNLVNGFLKDSGKSVVFSEDGGLNIKIDGVEGTRSVSYLSSGEAQIFVILTQLAFNKLSSKNNVFIIDEPELSLHVQWQEIFVDSIISANPNIQYILATHSPSIILDKVENCIDISRKMRNRGKSGD